MIVAHDSGRLKVNGAFSESEEDMVSPCPPQIDANGIISRVRPVPQTSLSHRSLCAMELAHWLLLLYIGHVSSLYVTHVCYRIANN